MYLYRILVVDDEEDLCEILQFNLENSGFKVDVVYSAEEALMKDLSVYSLLLIDVMMGDISGFKLAHIVRKEPDTSSIPFIFITAKTNENDRITGFAIGAEDYISKPFLTHELIVRVKSVISRLNKIKKLKINEDILFHNLEMRLISKKVLLNNIEISLTRKEFGILRLFLENKNHLFTRKEIFSHVWSGDKVVSNRTIDVNIMRLRKKIGTYENNIVTRLGYGYCFEE
jgi:two-component system, OmpR family, alkaline phosphatase synthesis response regulator PhoP